MFQLATILHSKGFSITIAHTHFNSPDPSNHPNFDFLPFFDGLSNTQITSKNFVDIASTLNIKCVSSLKETLVHYITKLANENHGEKIACIIYDGFLSFIDSLAKELKLPSIVFRTTSATNLLTYHVCLQLQSKGYLPLQGCILLYLFFPSHITVLTNYSSSKMLHIFNSFMRIIANESFKYIFSFLHTHTCEYFLWIRMCGCHNHNHE